MRRSLRRQLILISTLVSGVAIVGFAALSWYFLKRAEAEAVDLRLQGMVSRLARDLHPRVDFEAVAQSIESTYREEFLRDELVLEVIDDAEKRTIFSSAENAAIREQLPENFLPPAPELRPRPEWALGQRSPPEGRHLPGDRRPPENRPGGPPKGVPPVNGQEIHFGNMVMFGNPWRVAVTRDRGYFVLAALDLDKIDTGLDRIRTLLLVGVPLSLLLIASGGWFVAEKALRPIRRIAEATSRITTRDLAERIPNDRNTDTEIARLVTVLNGMMDRLERGFSHASRFSADVSHELKTPISVIQAEIESGLRDCEPGTAEENRLLVLREETDRLKSITRSLMLLSQADAGELIRKEEAVDLSEELEALVGDAEIIAESAGVAIESAIAPGAMVRGDPVLLRQALLNLVNNAIKYNFEGGHVRIALDREAEYIRIVVENSGPGIPEDDRAKVFERFYRADRARTRGVGGFGLGLSLARAVIEGHGGRLDLAESNEEITRFEVGFWQGSSVER